MIIAHSVFAVIWTSLFTVHVFYCYFRLIADSLSFQSVYFDQIFKFQMLMRSFMNSWTWITSFWAHLINVLYIIKFIKFDGFFFATKIAHVSVPSHKIWVKLILILCVICWEGQNRYLFILSIKTTKKLKKKQIM